jgi:SPP1 gp7 family putative phage head morphogenesis protein
VYLEQLKAGEIRRMDVTIRAIDRAVVAAINGLGTSPSRYRLDKALKVLRDQMSSLSDKQAEAYMKTLRSFSKYALEYNTSTINLVAPPNAPAVTPASAAAWSAALAAPIQATGSLLEPFVDTWGASSIRRVEGAIRVGYAQGLTTQQIVQKVRGTKVNKFRDGILGGVVKREADAMVRTSLQHISSQAQQLVYDDNDDIIEGYIWISTLDSRTTQQCRSLDGKFFKMGKGPTPPIHINCRSTTIPKIKGVDLLENTTRASKDGQVPADESYYDWLKRQNKAFQYDVLGPTRAALFREGGLSADQFARLNLDKNFQPLTLEEMRKKNPSAFDKAGL